MRLFFHMFPRNLGQILRYAFLRAPQVRYHFGDLPDFLPWLVRYFLASSPQRALHSAMAELPLIQRSLIEHEALIAEANVPELLRGPAGSNCFAPRRRLRARCRIWSAPGNMASRRGLDALAIIAREPHLTGDFGAIHFPRRASCRIPAAWPKPIRRCSAARARYLVGDARTLEQSGGRWRWRRWKA